MLWRGELIAAEADLEDALHFADSAGLQHTRPAVGWLAESLTDQGRYERAAAALNETWPEEQVPELGAWWFFLLARGRLALGRGRWSEAARDLQACGERYEAHGWRNPAIVPWRRLLAEALHEMGDYGAARSLTEVELELAREWGDDRSIANALRTLAVSYRGDKQLELLEESVALLASTSARLDYARSLVASGQARARAGDQPGSGQLLTEGLHVASVCGATPLAQVALQELRKLGFRPRRTFTSGLASLTAQEHRVAQLAASGLSNRQIAEQTYVTLKTVETHIASVLRKLSISSRRDIAERLQQSSELN